MVVLNYSNDCISVITSNNVINSLISVNLAETHCLDFSNASNVEFEDYFGMHTFAGPCVDIVGDEFGAVFCNNSIFSYYHFC